MVDITIDKEVLKVLKNYINNEEFDAIAALNYFSEDEFVFKFRYCKYKGCINAPAAKIIINFQEAIYKLVAQALKGKADIRLLSQQEKDELEIPFKITEGSTIEEISKLISNVKKVLKMIPEKHRAVTLVAIILIVFSFLGWWAYCSLEKTKIESEVLMQDNKSKENLLSKAIEKLGKEQPEIAHIVCDTDGEIISNLAEVDTSVEIQGHKITSEELKNIKRNKYPSRKKKVEIQQVNGLYKIIAVDLKNDYITVESATNSDIPPLRIYYERDTLLAYMQNLKEQLKNAIDNENNIFSISATTIKKNGKKDVMVLQSISEQKVKNYATEELSD